MADTPTPTLGAAIPDDVMQAARTAAADVECRNRVATKDIVAGLYRDGTRDNSIEVQAAAIAIISERARCAKLADNRGVGACERGVFDYSTGVFECRKLDRGYCNCGEFDELAEDIRVLTPPTNQMRAPMSKVIVISSFSFARGAIVRKDNGPNMLVVRQYGDLCACVLCEGDAGGTLRLREFKVSDLEQVLPTAAEQDSQFDLRWAADMRAIKRWQAAHPGNNLVWPNHADLCVWLMDQLDASHPHNLAEGVPDQ